MTKLWVDPPGGWRYGFPKQVDSNEPNMYKWLVDNGYPKDKIDEYGEYFYMSMWDVKEMN